MRDMPPRVLVFSLLLAMTACRTVMPDDTARSVLDSAERQLIEANSLAGQAMRSRLDDRAARFWSSCGAVAHQAMSATDPQIGEQAAQLATRCTDEFLRTALAPSSRRWSEGHTRIGNLELVVEFRRLSPYLEGPLALVRAQDVPVGIFGGQRFVRPGFGVPLAVTSRRCDDRSLCALLPPEGVFRWATAWIEADPVSNGSRLQLVIADPVAIGALVFGDRRYPLAIDSSAPYAKIAQVSKLNRLAIWGLLGGDDVGRRAGLYLLEDYDPNKRPIVMIHGLGGSPLAWARLSNALWGSPELRARFQIWHVVYQTDAPLLISRRRVQGYLDAGWRVLDPEGDDPARSDLVLIGHSLGGVLSRLLCVASGDALWSAAFTVPPAALRGDPEDLAVIESTFRFEPYPGVSRAIFMAAPHRGSPRADKGLGRLFRLLVGRRTPELESLRRLASENSQYVRAELRESYLESRLNSISTLQTSQPVRRAGESLMPGADIAYHTIAGALPGRQPETDGVVPLASSLLANAASTLVVKDGHKLYENDEAIAEVLRILREDLEQRDSAESSHSAFVVL